MMCDEKLEPNATKNMVRGEAYRLGLTFHLGYDMILNLIKVEGISPEYMSERCFFQFQTSAGIPNLRSGEELDSNARTRSRTNAVNNSTR